MKISESPLKPSKFTSTKGGHSSLSKVERQTGQKFRGPIAPMLVRSIHMYGLDHWAQYMESSKGGRFKNPGCESTARVICGNAKTKLFQKLSNGIQAFPDTYNFCFSIHRVDIYSSFRVFR